MSGGELEDADLSRINLSSVLKDEQKITIPYKVNEDDLAKPTTYISQTPSNVSSTSSIININYANEIELQKLNGIGTSMAKKIIAYREETGYFNSIEDIKNVSGIGEAKFNKIKDNITV